ncbi:MAG: glycosyltransferase family protein [Bacteroidota bacterium]|jgi:uncharacterized protein (TIGR00661 family)
MTSINTRTSVTKANILFAVQGEGRGHLSQAIVAFELLKKEGYNITGVIVGGNKTNHLPAYFRKRIQAPVYRIESPGFVRDKENKAVRLAPTILKTIIKIRAFWKSIHVIREVVKRQNPDLIINFYEPLIGAAHLTGSIRTRTISVAHQYLFLHPSFKFPETLSIADKWMLKKYTHLTAYGSNSLLTLSFNKKDLQKHGNLIPCPPLLRNEIKNAEPFHGKHLLVYIVNAGYMENIIQWNEKNPGVEIHCFTDSKKVKDKWEYNEALTFHSLNDQQFLRYMINAAAVVTTAGFESVCEAFYLGKPVMMVPVEGHAEQLCNALDGERAGVGIASEIFELTKVMEISKTENQDVEAFRLWTNRLEEIITTAINHTIGIGITDEEAKVSADVQYEPVYSIE